MEDLVSQLRKTYSGKRVLVTGHNGFKGTWLVALLNNLGAKVYGVSLQIETDSPFKSFHSIGEHETFIQNICDFSELKKILDLINPDVVFHLAARALVLDSYEQPIETFQVNVMGTANLLEALLNSSCKGVVVATTDKVYRNDNSGKYFKESDELWGHDPYSLSKTGTELVVSAWRNLPKMKDLQLVSVRAGNVFGPGDRARNRLMPDLVQGLSSGSETVIRNPHSIRPWQFVLDPLIGYLLVGKGILTGRPMSHAYNFGPEETSFISVAEFVRCLREIVPIRIKTLDEPDMLETKILKLDSTRALTELGWRPITKIVQGLESSMRIESQEIDPEVVNWFIEDYLLTFKNSLM